ncbi:glutathione peroxidase [bacterium]|nr:glutathione peroxidase [bacterium]
MKKKTIAIIKVIAQVTVLAVLILSFPYAVKLYEKHTIYDFLVNDAHGKEVKLEQYRGDVLLIVNVATGCGLTPQFLQLQKIYDTYRDKGFFILGFPSNSFNQEPRTNEQILLFCSDNFLVKFPIFERIDIKGEFQAPLYKFLTEKESDPEFYGPIRWNFDKFLIGRTGKILARFEPAKKPDDPEIIAAIEKALEQ